MEYIQSQSLRDWRGSKPTDVQQIVEKLNEISKSTAASCEFDEVGYKMSIATKYINVKCKKAKCRFALWFDTREENQFRLIRKVTISHCPASHEKVCK